MIAAILVLKHGASVGPVAGRIAKASFELNGQSYQVKSMVRIELWFYWLDGVICDRGSHKRGRHIYTERPDGTAASQKFENLDFYSYRKGD